MRHRALMVLIGFLAALLWVALLVLVNRKPPTAINQAIFLLLWGGAVTCTAIPVALIIQERRALFVGRRAATILGRGLNPGRAGRQGLLAGMLAAALMALRFLEMLNVLLGVFLILVAVMIEMLARSRETY
jgi:hypothetical protein